MRQPRYSRSEVLYSPLSLSCRNFRKMTVLKEKMEGNGNTNKDSRHEPKKRTATDEIKETISSAYRKLGHWIRPQNGPPLFLPFVMFILILPVLLLLLLLSPVLLVVLLLVSLIALRNWDSSQPAFLLYVPFCS